MGQRFGLTFSGALLDRLPQFAYTKGRGTADAPSQGPRALSMPSLFGWDRAVSTASSSRLAGSKHRALGAYAYPLISARLLIMSAGPPSIARSMTKGVSPTVVQAIQQLHFEARYHYRVGEHERSTRASNGIKQGCKIAPYLWSYFTVVFMLPLRDQRSQAWIDEVLTVFADDCWGAWITKTQSDLQQAVADLQLILETLETLKMTVNYQKTAVLLKLVGRSVASLRRDYLQ